jgi:hypothetical protein
MLEFGSKYNKELGVVVGEPPIELWSLPQYFV